ncbi:MAG: hypothetical protein GTO54_12910 [Nitrososphaeria archaeon]|nr:hypothetical protein [Nitrososphaeria archaeon]
MTKDEVVKLTMIYNKMKETAQKSEGPLFTILLPWIKELGDILESYHATGLLYPNEGNKKLGRRKS